MTKLNDVRVHTSHWKLKSIWPKDLSLTGRDWGREEHVSHWGASLCLCHFAAEMQCALGQWNWSLFILSIGEVILFWWRGSRALPLHLVQAHTVSAKLGGADLPVAPWCHEAPTWLFILSLNIQLCCVHCLSLPCSFRFWLLPDFVKHKFKTKKKLS